MKQNMVADSEEEAYFSNASGMGQTKGLSFISQEENKQDNRRSLPNEKSRLLIQNKPGIKSPGGQGTSDSD